MGRIVIAGVAGGIVFYAWGMLAWMALPFHVNSMGGLSNETAVTEALTSAHPESAVYAAPWSDNEEDWSDPESEWTERHLAGPIYTIFYHRDGCQPMAPSVMIGGLVIDILGGILAAALLWLALPRTPAFWQRVLFVTGLGLFVALIAHVGYWNWMRFHTDWTLAFVFDCIVGWALGGAAMGLILKPESAAAAE